MNILNVIKQVGEVQAKVKAMQAELEALEFSGESGAGLIKVTLSGKSDLKKIAIDSSLMKPGEGEMLEDLIMAAMADARAKVTNATTEKMASVTAGLPIPPGLKLF
jgi:DNA-binding YbaB/EbfC family protein